MIVLFLGAVNAQSTYSPIIAHGTYASLTEKSLAAYLDAVLTVTKEVRGVSFDADQKDLLAIGVTLTFASLPRDYQVTIARFDEVWLPIASSWNYLPTNKKDTFKAFIFHANQEMMNVLHASKGQSSDLEDCGCNSSTVHSSAHRSTNTSSSYSTSSSNNKPQNTKPASSTNRSSSTRTKPKSSTSYSQSSVSKSSSYKPSSTQSNKDNVNDLNRHHNQQNDNLRNLQEYQDYNHVDGYYTRQDDYTTNQYDYNDYQYDYNNGW